MGKWERYHGIVPSWVMNEISKKLYAGMVYSRSACLLWHDLKYRSDKVSGSLHLCPTQIIFALHREITALILETNLFTFTKLRQLLDEYGLL